VSDPTALALQAWLDAHPLPPTAREQRVNDLAREVDGGDVEDDPQMGDVAAGQWEDRWERQGRWMR
jgi:hypothetical protein